MLEIKIEGAKELKASLLKAVKNLTDTKKPLTTAGLYMMKSIDDNFRSEGRPEPWEGLSEMTKRRRRGSPPFAILQDTGALRQSIAMRLERDSVVVGTNMPYAAKLQFGGTNVMPAHDIFPVNAKALKFVINGRTIFTKKVSIPTMHLDVPARPFIVIQDEDVEAIEEIFNDWVGTIVEE